MKAIRVLIIDREAEFIAILADRLNSWGFQANAATNDIEALALLDRTDPEVVVLGIEAGHRDGLSLLDAIRSKNPAIKVILLAGKGAALTGAHGLQRGAFDVLPQPIELGLLIDTIRRAHRDQRR